MEKKYEVAEAIWIAAAVFAYKQYITKDELELSDVCLKAPELQKMAQEFTDKVVQLARIYQHNNGDHANCSHSFLRRLEVSTGNSLFRITATGEFKGDREYPDSINMNDEVEYEGRTYIIKNIKGFLDKEYAEFIKINTYAQQQSNIDYIGILEYLVENREVPYKDPTKSGLTDEERKRYLKVKSKGKKIVVELKKIHSVCSEKFKLEKCEKVSWDDGSHTKTKGCLWIPMKYMKYESRQESVSIFVEMKDENTAVYRVGLELRNDKSDANDIENYHKHLELPINEDARLIYVTGMDEWGKPKRVYDSQEEIIAKIKNKEYGKVQICKYIDRFEFTTNEEIQEAIFEAIEAILPYYKYVLGIKSEENLESMESLVANIENQEDNSLKFDKNIILYGPPGTGKTYNSAIYAVKVCEPDFDTSDYDKVMEKYNQLKAEHRIAFTTFHQSYGYEEFIEGIRPVLDGNSNELGYKIEPGVFKKFCEMARTPSNIAVNPNASIWFIRLESDNAKAIKDECFQTNTVIIDIKEGDDWSGNRFVDMMQIGDYVISYAGNSVYIDAIGVIEGEAVRDTEKENYQWSRKVNWTKLDNKVDVKAINSDTYLPNFSIAKMNHMKVSDLLRLLPNGVTNEEKPYVFVIDEINRGNISKIFGELITLIETTKREGEDEAANVILPYSGQSFGVPSNVYILGTMNTADRSIQLMDTALRRRFSFIEMMPDTDILRQMGIGEIEFDGTTLDVAGMLDAINDRIAFLYDREHTIGHAFFTGLKAKPTIEKLASIFENSIIPLLQEYFYEDYQKIQLVLGDNAKTDLSTKFILDKKVELKNLFMGSVEDVVDEKELKYEINSEAFRNIESYKRIANGL